MMFSTKAEYGVRVMAHLARAADEASARDGAGAVEAPISLGSIADAEGLPLAYLEHLVQRLRRAELVESRRGAHGGYTLARPAETISMAEVVRALEGEIAPIECITADPERGLVCVREDDLGDDPCPTKLLWTRVQGSIVRTLNEMTLADLVRPARRGHAKPDRSREAERRSTQSDRGAGRPAEVTITEKATA
jgi:Rrf2 family cysteine metabolism transcriptional repressor